ncbi:MAG: 30S ribosomal protein S6, partial [Deltaproteobacteria bacterium]|nr:30S ribosomal protein S6 [Deltaproteobacteria bacterium]MBW2535445.1 30S ribosomal protein S6 [Deltaproteobacteria bacterium]
MSRMAMAPGRAREYETIYVLRPTVDKDAVGTLTNKFVDAIKGKDGKLTELEFWGRRRLAYQIQRHHRGVYIYMKYLGRGDLVAELERQLRLADSVIRYQTILVRDNVVLEEAAVPEVSAELDIELPDEPDEPEVSRERELGLDGSHFDRDRRGRRDDRDRRDHRPPAEGEAAKPAEGEAAKPAEGEAAKPAEGEAAKPAEGEAAKPAEGEAAKP